MSMKLYKKQKKIKFTDSYDLYANTLVFKNENTSYANLLQTM